MDRDPAYLEPYFEKYINDLTGWLHDGVIEVDLALLHRLGLLKYHTVDHGRFSLTRYFQVLESSGKITLLNDQFVIWIVPENIDGVPSTFTLIALNHPEEPPRLEMAFSTTGIYNSSRLVLGVLEKFLYEIQETEDLLSALKKGSAQAG